jgi:hypothetical protein
VYEMFLFWSNGSLATDLTQDSWGVLVHARHYNKIQWTGHLMYKRNIFLSVLEAGSQDQGAGRVVSDKGCFLAHRQCPLTVPSCGGRNREPPGASDIGALMSHVS